jgi:2-polyprenyl-6-methoxyphenol hydroxylase-like FAD-dependent oxidoreductase
MNVLIVGAGIAGLASSFFLQRSGHNVTLVEKAPALRDEGYMLDFFGPGYCACERAGLLSDLKKIHCPIARLTFLNQRGRESVSVPYADIRKVFSGRHLNFMRGHLERLLYDKVKDRVEIRFATTIASFEQTTNVRIVFSDGTVESYDMLVGADGVHSEVRSLAFGAEQQFARPLGYCAGAFVMDDAPPGFERSQACLMLTVPGHLASIYPIPGGRCATSFLYRSDRCTQPSSDVQFISRLREGFGDADSIVHGVLRAPSSEPYFDSVAQIQMPRWRHGRVVLVGDACQCVSVMAGQGASLAVAAAYVLAEEIAGAPDDIAAALRRYEIRVRPGIEQTQAAGRKFASWLVPDSEARIFVRNLLMRASQWPGTQALLRRALAAENSVSV